MIILALTNIASVFSNTFYIHFDGVLLVSRLVINKIMSGRLYDVITSLRHISREFRRRLSVEIKRRQKQWGKSLSSDMKTIIIRNNEVGKSYSEIGRNLQLNRATVYAVVKRYRERGDIENRPRSGRKKTLDDRVTRKLLRLAKNNRLLPLQDIARKFNENREDVVSSVTVRRCLYRNNFHRRVVRKHIRIREANVKGSLAWAPGKRYWTVERDWSRVIFSDECKIIVGENNRVFAWRKPSEEWLPQCLSPGCNAKMSLMIWGCITFNGVDTFNDREWKH